MDINKAAEVIVQRLMSVVLVGLCLESAAAAGAAGCTLTVTSAPPALNLPVTAASLQHILVGELLQDCSGNASYTLVIESVNCLQSPAGAKLSDPLTKEYVRYSVEFRNPTSGGSLPIAPGLLANACSAVVGRGVAKAKIKAELSAVYIDFTGTAMLAAGTYSDTLSVTLNIK